MAKQQVVGSDLSDNDVIVVSSSVPSGSAAKLNVTSDDDLRRQRLVANPIARLVGSLSRKIKNPQRGQTQEFANFCTGKILIILAH